MMCVSSAMMGSSSVASLNPAVASYASKFLKPGANVNVATLLDLLSGIVL